MDVMTNFRKNKMIIVGVEGKERSEGRLTSCPAQSLVHQKE